MSPHILIVDADNTAARVTSAGVERVVPEATLAVEPDPEKAWLSLQRQTPDVLIIDPSPYRLAGALLIQVFKEECPAAHVIVLASAPTPALRRALQRLGVDVYLEKPVPLPLLTQELRATLLAAQPRVRNGPASDVHPT